MRRSLMLIRQYGKSTTSYSIVDAFDNDPLAREFQDVGLDGMRDEDEDCFSRKVILI